MNEIVLLRLVNKVQNFTVALTALLEAIDFLEQDCKGQKVSQRADCWEDTKHAKSRIDLLAPERPNRVCVLVLGEFKAGKSTLINALVGQTVAATDTFEMTTAVARIIPTDKAEAHVILSDKNKERPVKRMSLNEFLQFSVVQAEKLKADNNAVIEGYTQARIFVPSDLDAELVDTPGLGATLDNELNAVDAISTCDVILWTVDAQNIGGAREAAMLDRIQRSGQPLICALTKSDALESDEILPTIEYLSDSYSIAIPSIFAVSAEKYLLDKDDPGTTRLKEHIQSSVVVKGAMLREKALLAQASDISGEIVVCLSSVEQRVGEALRDAEENYEAFLAMAHNVTDRLCNEFAVAIKHQLRSDMEKHLMGATNLMLEEKIRESLEQSMKNLSNASLFDHLNLKDKYKDLWLDGIKSELQMLQTSLSEVRQEAVHKAVDAATPVLEKQIRTVKQKEKAIEHSINAASIFAAVSFLSIPLAAIVAAPQAFKAYMALDSANIGWNENELLQLAQEKEAETYFTHVAENFVKQLSPELKTRNEKVAKGAADDFARNNTIWPLSLDELNGLYNQCVALRARLEVI